MNENNKDIKIPDSQIIETKFEDLNVNKKLKEALQEMNMIKMTPIQAKCIPHLLEGNDLMGAAKTGSGKTLAFLVPLVQKVLSCNFEPRHGTAAIVMSPTRELSLQIFEVLRKLVAHTDLRTGLLVGGNNRNIEAKCLREGVTIIVATPGRLLDHLNNTELFLFHRLQTLIIDEADRLMEQGFLDEMKAIVKKLPKSRQTVLFSATLKTNSAKLKTKIKKQITDSSTKKASLDDKVLTLAYLSLRENCICVDLSNVDLVTLNNNAENKDSATVSQLTQSYIVCKSSDRFRLLYTFIKKNMKKKIMVFMSTCLEVKYFYELFNIINVPVLALHGKQNQSKRLSNFEKFKEKEFAIILCTDVAARGLDVPHVDWVIQYDPPDDPKEYIHRVGRTARAGAAGQALLFLRPEEIDFLALLNKHKVPLMGLEFEESKLLPIQESLENIVDSNCYLQSSAKLAFTTFVKSYSTNSLKCFDINKLDMNALATTFGLKAPPQVLINVSMKSKKKRPQKRGFDYSNDTDNNFVSSKQLKTNK